MSVEEIKNVKKLTTKTNTLHELQRLKNKLPQRGALEKGLGLFNNRHNQDKQDLIDAVNTEIANYNNYFKESPIEQINIKA